jgi:hypothetical protein
MTSDVERVFWDGLFSEADGKVEPEALGRLEFADGAAFPLVPYLRCGTLFERTVDADLYLWPVDPLRHDRWHRALPGDVALWRSQGASVEPVRWHEGGRVHRALLVSDDPTPFGREGRYPLLRIRGGEVWRHHMEGGWEAKGWFAGSDFLEERLTMDGPDERLRAQLGHGWVHVRFADVDEVYVDEIRIEEGVARGTRRAFVVVHAIGDGRENRFRFDVATIQGHPRAWLRATLAKTAFLPGSEEWWP